MALSGIQKQYARLLHQRGKTHEYIAKCLGIARSTVTNLKKDEGWGEDLLPKFTRQELIENAEILIFRCQMSLLTGEEEDFTRGTLNHSKLTEALNKLEDSTSKREDRQEAVTQRNIIEGLKLAMEILAGRGEVENLEFLQNLYDEKVKEL